MPERKKNRILSLNVKVLLILHLVFENKQESTLIWLPTGTLIFIIQLCDLFFFLFEDNFHKYSRAFTKYFLGTVLVVASCVSVLSIKS